MHLHSSYQRVCLLLEQDLFTGYNTTKKTKGVIVKYGQNLKVAKKKKPREPAYDQSKQHCGSFVAILSSSQLPLAN